jgi:hypothetical protein
MTLDLIGAVALTAAASALVAAYAFLPRWSPPRRAAFAAVLVAWFAGVVACGAAGAFDAVRGTGPAGVGAAVLAPLAILAAFGLRKSSMAEALEAIPLRALIGLHAVRLLGIFFVLLFAAERLPAPFAPLAGWGDVLVGLLALPVAYLAATEAPAWRATALAWNTFGLADLVVAVGLGVASSPGLPFRLAAQGADSSTMTTLPWILIPCFLVPMLAFIHLLVFRRLRADRRRTVHAYP